MSIEITFTPDRPNGPFEAAHVELLKGLVAVQIPPALSLTPQRGEFQGVGDYLRAVVGVADRWLQSVGVQVVANSTASEVQLDLFEDAFLGAVDGFALWGIERSEERVIDEPYWRRWGMSRAVAVG